eukprot:12881043-Prorocentrum_lima.AAC.1
MGWYQVAGSLPGELMESLMCQVAKPGPVPAYRPIGVLPTTYRVWSRLQYRHFAAWEAANDRDYFGAGKGRGPGDPPWRAA